MTFSVFVQVPIGEDADLQALLDQAGSPDSQLIETHPFDGETVIQAALVLIPTSMSVLKTWLRSRANERKSFKIAYRGIELSGYTPAEADQIIQRLEKDLGPAELNEDD